MEVRRNGRIGGDQKNEAAEAQAILRVLLNARPKDKVHIFSDNMGCVQKWMRMERFDREGEMINWENRATWHRITGIIKEREANKTETRLKWIHSHVDDEARRTAPTKGTRCACRTDPNRDECAKPGEPTYWMHKGNEEADAEAKEGAHKEPDHDIVEVARGESEYILHCGQNVAQGCYTKWVRQWQNRMTKLKMGTGQKDRPKAAKKMGGSNGCVRSKGDESDHETDRHER